MATSPPLTIRNLTATPIELKLVERYEAPGKIEDEGARMSSVEGMTKNFTTLISNTTAPSAPKLVENSQSFTNQTVNLCIEAFGTSRTEINHTEKGSTDVLRLTFEVEGEKHRLNTSIRSNASTVLTPLTQSPRYRFTAVFLLQFSHLSLYYSTNLNSWMRDFKDETPLPALSIPGTHNSATYYKALPSVRCQAVSPKEQMENGIRFLDIRVQPVYPDDPAKDDLILVHGVFPISLTGAKYFRDLVNEVEAFLDRNPSETVILSLKREGPGRAKDAQLSKILRDHYASDMSRWFTAPRIPFLGEVRNKIVLMRRFTLDDSLKEEWGGHGWCINAETWAYNTPDDVCPSGDVCVQDFCEVLETEYIDKKIKFAEDHLNRAARFVAPLDGDIFAQNAPTKIPFHINFLSASNFWRVGCWPEKVAAKLNPAMVDFLCRKHNEDEAIQALEGGKTRKAGDGSTGIVVCDWVGWNGNWDLVRCIVGMNAKLELRGKSTL
jgi:1-phosphatidylinositol phosphodiesterase